MRIIVIADGEPDSANATTPDVDAKRRGRSRGAGSRPSLRSASLRGGVLGGALFHRFSSDGCEAENRDGCWWPAPAAFVLLAKAVETAYSRAKQ